MSRWRNGNGSSKVWTRSVRGLDIAEIALKPPQRPSKGIGSQFGHLSRRCSNWLEKGRAAWRVVTRTRLVFCEVT